MTLVVGDAKSTKDGRKPGHKRRGVSPHGHAFLFCLAVPERDAVGVYSNRGQDNLFELNFNRGELVHLILLIVLILLLLGAFPQVGLHSYGYGPSGGIGLIVIILVILLLTGRI